ncbi:MAG: cytochrome b/b6 domain-containing protein [Gaiellaceae bacterium]
MAEPTLYVERFSRTERAVHWVHAAAFFVLLGSGLVLYLPALADRIGRRPFLKDVHVYTAVAWLVALGLIVRLGDRRGLRRTVRDLEWFDEDDRGWLRGRRTPQGRFNAGQKLNAAVSAGLAALFAISGFLLWLGERNTSYRFANTVLVHDWLMWVSLVLLVGHLYLAVIHPATRHAMRGITRGSVSYDWAEAHHPKWVKRPD